MAEEGDNHHKMQEEDILHRTAAVAAEQTGILLVVEGKDNLVLIYKYNSINLEFEKEENETLT